MMKKPDLIFLSLTEAAKQLFGYEQVAKRIANIRLTEFGSTVFLRLSFQNKHRHKNKPAISDKMPMISLLLGLYFSEMDENSVIGYQSR